MKKFVLMTIVMGCAFLTGCALQSDLDDKIFVQKQEIRNLKEENRNLKEEINNIKVFISDTHTSFLKGDELLDNRVTKLEDELSVPVGIRKKELEDRLDIIDMRANAIMKGMLLLAEESDSHAGKINEHEIALRGVAKILKMANEMFEVINERLRRVEDNLGFNER